MIEGNREKEGSRMECYEGLSLQSQIAQNEGRAVTETGSDKMKRRQNDTVAR